MPNLVCTQSFLAVFGDPAIFVLLRSIALLGSTYFMRYPSFVRS